MFYIYTTCSLNNIISSIYSLFRSYSYCSSHSRSRHSSIGYGFNHITRIAIMICVNYKSFILLWLFKPQINTIIVIKYFYIPKAIPIINTSSLKYFIFRRIVIELYYCVKWSTITIIRITKNSHCNHSGITS
jgi:hypothetical protein